MTIRQRMDTEKSREFWADIDGLEEFDLETFELPYIGDPWWKAEKELSVSLLSIKDKK